MGRFMFTTELNKTKKEIAPLSGGRTTEWKMDGNNRNLDYGAADDNNFCSKHKQNNNCTIDPCILSECAFLLKCGAIRSCEMVASICLSHRQKVRQQHMMNRRRRHVVVEDHGRADHRNHNGNDVVDPSSDDDEMAAKMFEILGDCRSSDGRHRSAESCYRRAAELRRDVSIVRIPSRRAEQGVTDEKQPGGPPLNSVEDGKSGDNDHINEEENVFDGNCARIVGEITLQLKRSRSLSSSGKTSEALSVASCALASFLSSSNSSAGLKDLQKEQLGRFDLAAEGLLLEKASLSLLMGRLDDAASSLLDLLRRNPYQLGALVTLCDLCRSSSSFSTSSRGLSSATFAKTATVFHGLRENDVLNAVKEGVSRRNSRFGVAGRDGQHVLRQKQRPLHPILPLEDIVSAFYVSNDVAGGSGTGINLSSSVSPALSRLAVLDQKFPDNVFLLERIALLQARAGDYDSSERTFTKIRRLEPYRIDHMDRYAEVLYKRYQNCHGQKHGRDVVGGWGPNATSTRMRAAHLTSSELGRLASELLEVDDRRSEPWIVLALYHASTAAASLSLEDADDHGDNEDGGGGNADSSCRRERALACVERALSLDPRSGAAHRVRGDLCMASDRPDEASASFRRSVDLQTTGMVAVAVGGGVDDMDGHEGLIDALLADGRCREATSAARRCATAHPRDHRALALVGLALAGSFDQQRRQQQQQRHSVVAAADANMRERAKRALRKALAIDPHALRPLFALSDLYASEGDLRSCVDLLSSAAESFPASSPSGGGAWRGVGGGGGGRHLIHARLGDAYAAADDHDAALGHYHAAVSLEPGNADARRGLERLERLMRGLDPDAPERDPDEEELDDDEEDEGDVDDSGNGNGDRRHGYDVDMEEEATNFEVDAGARGYL